MQSDEISHSEPFLSFLFRIMQQRHEALKKTDFWHLPNWHISKLSTYETLNLESYHKQCPKHKKSEHWSLWNFKLRAGNLSLKLPECNLGNPPQNTTCNAPQNTKLQRKCCVDAGSRSFLATHLKWWKPLGNAPQNTNPVSRAHPKLRFDSWQRTWNYKTHLKSHCRLTCQYAAGMRIWEKHLERGNPQKAEWRAETQQKTRKTANPSWFWTSHALKETKHTTIWSRNKREHLQNKIAKQKWTAASGLLKERDHRNPTRENRVNIRSFGMSSWQL